MMALVAMCEHIVHCNAPAEISHPQQCEFRIVSGMALAAGVLPITGGQSPSWLIAGMANHRWIATGHGKTPVASAMPAWQNTGG